MDYIEILKILALANVITNFTPLQWILDILPNNMIKYILIVLTSCWKCCSLWLGLALFGLWPAVVASIAAATLTSLGSKLDQIWIKKITNNDV